MELDFFIIINNLTAATAIMLGLLFMTSPSKNRRANIFLGLFLWSLAIEVVGVISDAFYEEFIYIPETSLATIPFLVLYINQTINSKIKGWYVALFIPVVLVNFLDLEEGTQWMLRLFDYVFNISLLLFILRIVKKHSIRVNSFYSDLEHKTIRWITIIVYIYLGFYMLWFIEDIVVTQNENLVESFAKLSTVLTFFMVYWIGYNGFTQHETFKQQVFHREEDIPFEEVDSKEKELDMISEADMLLFEKMCVRIDSEKLYANSKLTLNILSDALALPSRDVSRLINLNTKGNFYQFINGLRTEEFKRLLESPKAQKMSILGLAEESGFSSKSTFYTVFKSMEGMTPKAYELSLKESE
ncbi:helix-turn-helix domain-containing protein [Dokdonia sp.]|uniref:helix-turn-helix domain-containing protein n=1 Tax=Dokdonia sp. TaxID=2024995 RepID=UPI003263EE22